MSSTASAAHLSAPPPFFLSPTLQSEILGFLSQARSNATLYELEGRLRRLRQAFAAFLLDELREALQERERALGVPLCPSCSTRMHRNRIELRTLHLLEGCLPLPRGYWECRPCKVYLHPIDRDLDLPVDGEVAPRFGHDLCRLGVELPYRTGAEILEVLTGRELDPATLRNQVCREGEALFGLEKEEAEAYAALEPGERKARLAALPELRSTPIPSGSLVVELDGVMGNVGADAEVKAEIRAWETREETAKREGRTFDTSKPSVFRETLNARFYRLEDRVQKKTKSGKLRSEILRSETVSVVNDPGLFRQRIYAVAEDWKAYGHPAHRYQAIVVLGDGAIFERGIHDTLRPIWEVLDFSHAKGHVYECARALFGEEAEAARGWGKRWSDSLFTTGAGSLLVELARQLLLYQERGEEPPKKLANLHGYTTRHQARMRYPLFRKLGFPIASGAVESVNRSVFGDRCKRSGMGWKRSSLQALLSLRAALKSGNWEEVCAATRQTRSCRNSPRQVTAEAPTTIRPAAPDLPPEELLEPPRRLPMRRRTGGGAPAWKLGRRIAAGLLQVHQGELSPGRGISP